MRLPPALEAWSPDLDLFPRELMAPLAALARPIDSLVGPLRDPRRRGADGEPDGYSDIGRRGPYERLLLSEWLLATEEPDEWLRRAVAGEHSFLEISRRKPVSDRISAVLFDTGPSQWGSARLAHLAALIVLHRRARAAGARFAWGILQKPPSGESLWRDVTEANVLCLTGGAAPREATEADIAAWRDFISPSASRNAESPDFWIVGAKRLSAFTNSFPASLLSVEEPVDFGTVSDGESKVDDDARYLIANAHFGRAVAPRAVARDVRLPLPPPSVSVRLLRDPFGVKAHKPGVAARPKPDAAPRDAAASDLVFSLHGSKLFARAAAFGGTTLLVYPIGNSPAANVVSPPKQYRSQFGNPFFAVGRVGKANIMATLTSDGSEVRIETINKTAGVVSGAYRLVSEEAQLLFAGKKRNSRSLDSQLLSSGLGDIYKQKSVSSADGSCGAIDRTRLSPIVPLFSPDGRLIVAELVTALPDGRLIRLRWDDEKEEGIGIVSEIRCLALHRGSHGAALIAGMAAARYIVHDKPSFDGYKAIGYDKILMVPADTSNFEPVAFQDGLDFGDPVAVMPSASSDSVTVAYFEHLHLHLPAGERLVGIAKSGLPVKPARASLLLLSADSRTISYASIDEPDKLTTILRTSGAAISRVTKSPYAPLIAYTTEDGEVGVWSLPHRDYVYHRLPYPSEPNW